MLEDELKKRYSLDNGDRKSTDDSWRNGRNSRLNKSRKKKYRNDDTKFEDENTGRLLKESSDHLHLRNSENIKRKRLPLNRDTDLRKTHDTRLLLRQRLCPSCGQRSFPNRSWNLNATKRLSKRRHKKRNRPKPHQRTKHRGRTLRQRCWKWTNGTQKLNLKLCSKRRLFEKQAAKRNTCWRRPKFNDRYNHLRYSVNRRLIESEEETLHYGTTNLGSLRKT